ncbi:radical SAM protein [Catellatospora coxensis]|uniref:Radical SAM core domain-containing protein n=1 Tax=Catellatospora coxensis TaxID=310354 RepID=A0A8J3KWQ2_9ACTN|nr:radical SAM protein [Catellatospora coxensis]GIG06659.1 hypothetical protein Cco03nite_33590 [Catellatospora coxensis]
MVQNRVESLWRWSPDARFLRNDHGGVAVNFASAVTLPVDRDHADAVASISGITTPFELPAALDSGLCDALHTAGFLIEEQRAAPTERLVLERIAAALQRSHGFIVMPTEQCNFRCTYCYESFAKGRMADANVAALEKAIDDAASVAPQFGLAFFGGEPLLCADIVLRLSQRALQAVAGRGLPYAASISTNGSLLRPALFTSLLDAGVVGYQITIDGSAQVHDSQRKTAGGLPTFRRIVENLRAMAQSDEKFHCVLRCNVRDTDRDSILTLVDDADALGFIRDDARFLVDIHQIWSSDRQTVSGGHALPGCASSLTREVDFFVLNRLLAEQGVRTTTYDRLPGIMGSACYAGKPNWFVVGSDLSLYKCTVVFDNERNQVGRIDPDGALVIDDGKNLLWTGSNALTDQGCTGCQYRVPCGGIACPLSRFTTGVKGCPDMRGPQYLKAWARSHPASPSHDAPRRLQLPVVAVQ